jgi:uncharacterized protein
MNQTRNPNQLIHSSSPYLKQHAYNPVQWHPWGPETLKKARDEDKPMIISIGYSACHWCHVMERESFENEEIASVMNEGFVCIKVDREERPDVDQIYMEAIQTMGLSGGWPLNVFTMPDQKPFYGGTYFPPRQWLQILRSILQGFKEQRPQLEASAVEFAKSLSVSDSQKYGLEDQGQIPAMDKLHTMVQSMKKHLDYEEGGLKRAPKFPNPSIWNFLLTANSLLDDPEIWKHLLLTLHKMASGGIYDQVGGGFARYSVDDHWFAPHFEKMLYDNGQLISLYSMAYQATRDEKFREVVYQSVEFIERELTSPDYGFYSALDADSEGEEGNFYIWSSEELDSLLGDDAEIIKSYFNVSDSGNWERGMNILNTSGLVSDFCKHNDLEEAAFLSKLQQARGIMLAARGNRVRPGLDDKIISGWNAIMLQGLLDAYHAFGDNIFLDLALKNAQFIQSELILNDVLLRTHSRKGNHIAGYLEDYALAIQAFFTLYQTTFDDQWLNLSVNLTDYAIANFYDPTEELFFFTDRNSEALIARKKEIFDNVIPASNSVMANNLYFLGHLIENDKYVTMSRQMLSKVTPMLLQEVQYLTNWGTLYAHACSPLAEIAIIGEKYLSFSSDMHKFYIPGKIIAASKDGGRLPLLQHREAIDGKTTLYVCFDKSCKLPVFTVEDALKQLEQ